MGANLAFLICGLGIAGLFYLNRDKSVRTSAALWLPVIWLWIAGSRPASMWLAGGGDSGGGLASTLDGSPVDAAFYAVLMAIGTLVLLYRWRRTRAFVAKNGPIIVYLLYCLISVAWSPFHGPAFKRWTKDLGDVVMVLVIVTDARPVAALRRMYSRIGFLLLPLSVVFIRYTDMGRGYDPSGNPANIGVTLNKNDLGRIAFLVSLGALWTVLSLLSDKDKPNRGRHLTAQVALLTFGIVILQMAHSATCVACFILGAGLMLVTRLRSIRVRPARVHAVCALIVLAGGIMYLSGGEAVVTSLLGRQADLTGRTDIWRASLGAAGNPWIGTGFESFWNANVGKVARALPGYWGIGDLVSAHNGYIEVYLNLGWIGVCLIALILISGYRNAARAFRREPGLGSLFLAGIVSGAIYSITEAGFRLLSSGWIFLLIAVVGASGLGNGLFVDAPQEVPTSRDARTNKMLVRKNLNETPETVLTVRRSWS